MKRFKTQGGTDDMRNWSRTSNSGEIWQFPLMFPSHLGCCWKYSEITDPREESCPHRVWQDDKLVGTIAKTWNNFLSWTSLIAECGGRSITQWVTQKKTSVSFQLLASLSYVLLELSGTLCSRAANTHSIETNIHVQHTHCAADESRRSTLWIIEPSW